MGLSLPEPALEKIYCRNFERLAGTRPKKLDLVKAAEECERIAKIASKSGVKPEDNEAAKIASLLRGLF
ncbi:MAG: hypothetical protein JTT11_03585, partial [Candidatus Brockarchaeota archaeon]|nr:hypothetical protein [Candidatus Brockarchaeota archaeon]